MIAYTLLTQIKRVLKRKYFYLITTLILIFPNGPDWVPCSGKSLWAIDVATFKIIVPDN